MKITYCKSWSRFKKRPIEIWDEKKALKAHTEGELYTVLIGEENQPKCFLEISLKLHFVGVTFLDDNLRDYLDYSFKEVTPKNLFLNRLICREYILETDTVSKAQIFIFNIDGNATIEEKSQSTGKCFSKNVQLDVSKNWEIVPEFGQYESISRIER